MLQHKHLLQEQKNLLAFSAGVDSTALLFLLLEHNISFDIAIVDYGIRAQSKEEVAYAQALAKEHHFTCHLLQAKRINTNFEANARALRYEFFEQLIKEHHYNNLLTAHHLGDRLEWMLMQLCRGAGCVSLAGMQALDRRKGYNIIRPLLHLDKPELQAYLQQHNYRYFIDASNSDPKYTRNTFRHNFATPLLQQYRQGIKKSFTYIDEDLQRLQEASPLQQCHALAYFVRTHTKNSDTLLIDKHLKSLGILMSANERALLKEHEAVVISRRYIVWFAPKHVFMAPYIKATKLEKQLKEQLRQLRVTPKLRGYLASDTTAVRLLSLLLQ